MTNRKRRQLFNPFMFRRFSQCDDNNQAESNGSSHYSNGYSHNPFGQLFAPYPRLQPDPVIKDDDAKKVVTKTNKMPPIDPLFGFESEPRFESKENILPLSKTININAIHAYTKEIIATLHTIDKSLELVVKALTLLDNYNINLSSLTGTAPKTGGPNVLKLATDFIKKIDVNQLEQAVNLIQSPMIVDLLTNGLNFEDEASENSN